MTKIKNAWPLFFLLCFPSAEKHHIWKESVLLFLLVVTLGCYWYAYQQNKRSQKQLKRMMKDMESLSHAEKALANMQKELTSTKEEDELAERTRRSDLEKKIRSEIIQKVRHCEAKSRLSVIFPFLFPQSAVLASIDQCFISPARTDVTSPSVLVSRLVFLELSRLRCFNQAGDRI